MKKIKKWTGKYISIEYPEDIDEIDSITFIRNESGQKFPVFCPDIIAFVHHYLKETVIKKVQETQIKTVDDVLKFLS